MRTEEERLSADLLSPRAFSNYLIRDCLIAITYILRVYSLKFGLKFSVVIYVMSGHSAAVRSIH